MTDPHDSADLTRAALEHAVSDVEPTDRLAAIRARTARSTTRRRRGWALTGGAVLAAAAVAVAVAVVAAPGPRDGLDVAVDGPTPATPTSATSTTTTTPVYYLGPGGSGPDADDEALYRYFEPEGDPLELLMSQPSDPDYRTSWPAGSLRSYEVSDDAITVQVADEVTGAESSAWQQVIYTLQAVTGTRLPVRFVNPVVDLGAIEQLPALDVLSHVSISDPAEGNHYDGSFTARGVGNGFEGTIVCRLLDGDREAWRGITTSEWLEPRLFPWELTVDLTDVAPGTYSFSCATDDPTGGAEGSGAFTDTRTITVDPA